MIFIVIVEIPAFLWSYWISLWTRSRLNIKTSPTDIFQKTRRSPA